MTYLFCFKQHLGKLANQFPWNFSPPFCEDSSVKRTWVKGSLKLDDVSQFEIIYDPTGHKKEALITNFVPPQYYRINHDREVRYGDGGANQLVFPIWACDQLQLGINSSTVFNKSR